MRQYLLEKSNPLNPLYPCSFNKVFVLPAEIFSNTNYKDVHGCYCLVVYNSCLRRVIRSIRVRFTNRVFRTRIIRIFTDVIALRQCSLEKINPLNPLYPCSLYQQCSFRTRIIKIFTDVIALRKLSVQSVQSVFA